MTTLSINPQLARRLFVHQQRLTAPLPKPNADSMLQLVRDIGCLQLDPLTVVARSHQIVLFSRLGPYDPAEFDTLLFEHRTLFEYWAHCASIVTTEDYPIHSVRMRAYGGRSSTSQLKAWAEKNKGLKTSILNHLRRKGPTLSRDLEMLNPVSERWVSSGWTSGRDVNQMLDYLWMAGEIMVVGRQGIQKVWGLSKHHLPDWTPREKLTEREMSRRSVLKSLQALGVATAKHINYHFIRGRYRELPQVLAELEAEGKIVRVEIKDKRTAWPGVWYMRADAAPTLEALADDGWQPRTTLISPFDNLIADRVRTIQFFNFDFKIEIYVPEAKRKYGYYVLPVLYGDKLIGRIDPKIDRENGILNVNAVHAEPDAPKVGAEVRKSIESLATFLGASEINYNSKRVPDVWKKKLLG
jgi:uncharacterized protein